MARTEHFSNVRVCWRVRICGNSHFVSLAADACCRGWRVGNHRKQGKEGKASSLVSGFCLLLSRYRRFCLLSAVGCVEDAKRQEKRRGGGGGGGVRVWNMLGFSSCSQSACVRACVCMFSFSKILLKFFPLIYIE
jgi:hypothetical protein